MSLLETTYRAVIQSTDGKWVDNCSSPNKIDVRAIDLACTLDRMHRAGIHPTVGSSVDLQGQRTYKIINICYLSTFSDVEKVHVTVTFAL